MNARSAADSLASSTTVETAGKHPLHRDITVSIRNYSYHPTTLTVTIGAKVTFTNRDQTSHTATSTKTAFDTGTVTPGHSAAVVFTKPGIYTYYCQFHAFMRGTIIVK